MRSLQAIISVLKSAIEDEGNVPIKLVGLLLICESADKLAEEESPTDMSSDIYATLGRASARPKEARDKMEANDYAFTDFNDRWQKLAFTFYSMLVEYALEADNLLMDMHESKG